MAEQPDAAGSDKGSRAHAHAEARSRVASTIALGLTHRVIALVAVAAILVVSFVSSLSVYFRQQHQIVATEQAIADNSQAIADLQDQWARWQDPAYIEAQARDRLGWVMPGEIGYRVVDANGAVIGGLVPTIGAQDATPTGPWYETLWQSLQLADQPLPPDQPTTPSAPTTIGPDDADVPH